jgi:hypothetical protein
LTWDAAKDGFMVEKRASAMRHDKEKLSSHRMGNREK